jgi:Txe/YoeB family toxin of Txe-Axe toxin-antitoxin module
VVTGASEKNRDNLNVRCEAEIHFRNKKREYLNNKIKELVKNSKNKNFRDMNRGRNEFKKYLSEGVESTFRFLL